MPEAGIQLELDLGVDGIGGADASDRFFEGYMTAMAVCPVDVPMEEILEAVLAEDAAAVVAGGGVEDLEQGFWKLRELLLFEPKNYSPMLVRAGLEGRHEAADWAVGFLTGISLRGGIWKDKLRTPDYWDAAAPIFEIASQHPRFAELFPSAAPAIEAWSDNDMEEILEELPGAVTGLFALRLEALAAQHEPYRREGAKTGRNDPCPCGSGKKYKKCCGA